MSIADPGYVNAGGLNLILQSLGSSPTANQSVELMGTNTVADPFNLGRIISIYTPYSAAVIDFYLGFSYTLNKDKAYIGIKPKAAVKIMSGLVYPFITSATTKEQ